MIAKKAERRDLLHFIQLINRLHKLPKNNRAHIYLCFRVLNDPTTRSLSPKNIPNNPADIMQKYLFPHLNVYSFIQT